jgi:DNA helicase-2/ATP-dependent DNA helicase PcrA
MAKTRLNNLETMNEFQQIMAHINNGNNFLLSGGAGSGKTYTLINVIKQIIEENPTSTIACMTYTNAAVKEIEERVNHKNLQVTTIHDFLWDNIKHYQLDLKKSLIGLINDEETTRIRIDGVGVIQDNYFDTLEDGIQYKEYVRISEGIISHDEVLILANRMFKNYPKINSILKDKFKFILIDEYQDTSPLVVEIFLKHLKQSDKKNIIGFFGDSMQSIYDDGVGNLDEFKGEQVGSVKEVIKAENRRNPKLVIGLANRLRTDDVVQAASNDIEAPNIEQNGVVKIGTIKFIHSSVYEDANLKEYLNWDFENTNETKELNLTHNLIADKAGIRTLMNIYNDDGILKYKSRVKKYIKDNNINTDFSDYTFNQVRTELGVDPTNAMNNFIEGHPALFQSALDQNWLAFSKIYVDKDQLLDSKKQSSEENSKKGSKRDALIKHLFKIQNSIGFYTSKQYNEFLRSTDYRIKVKNIADKIRLKENIESLKDVGDKTIGEIIDAADVHGICLKDDILQKFITEKEYVYDRVKDVKFSEFQNLYKYLEGFTPFSTQHKTKGAEFDNVLVVLDNGRWNQYNFEYLFLENGNPSVLERTRKIFYVCCTRAKDNLAVYFVNPGDAVLQKAKEWFNDENVIDLDNL